MLHWNDPFAVGVEDPFLNPNVVYYPELMNIRIQDICAFHDEKSAWPIARYTVTRNRSGYLINFYTLIAQKPARQVLVYDLTEELLLWLAATLKPREPG